MTSFESAGVFHDSQFIANIKKELNDNVAVRLMWILQKTISSCLLGHCSLFLNQKVTKISIYTAS